MRRRALVFIALAAIPSAMASCSLVTSLDGLQGDARDASADVAIVDTSSIDSPIIAADASDAANGLLSCSADGLVAYWPMDENAGQTIHDCHQGLDGIFGSSGVAWGARSAGKVDLEFSSAGYVSFGVPVQLRLPGPFTVAGWFRVDSLPDDYISLFWNYGGDDGNHIGFEITMESDGKTYTQIGFGNNDSISTPYSAVPLGVWIHLAMTFTPGVELRTYINGATDNVNTTLDDGGSLVGYSVAPNDQPARCGADQMDSMWQGGIDDVRIFSRVLSAPEISALASE